MDSEIRRVVEIALLDALRRQESKNPDVYIANVTVENVIPVANYLRLFLCKGEVFYRSHSPAWKGGGLTKNKYFVAVAKSGEAVNIYPSNDICWAIAGSVELINADGELKLVFMGERLESCCYSESWIVREKQFIRLDFLSEEERVILSRHLTQ